MSSYLASVKDDLKKLISALSDELRKAESQEEWDETLKEWTNEVWRFFEQKLKESYINGRAAKKDGNGNGETTKKKRFTDWKSRKEEG